MYLHFYNMKSQHRSTGHLATIEGNRANSGFVEQGHVACELSAAVDGTFGHYSG